MAQEVKLVVYPASDVAAAKVFYGAFLGVEPYADSPYYVGYKLDDGMEIGLDPNGQAVIAYTEVEDIQAYMQTLVAAGGTVAQEPKDVGGGLLIAQIKDPNGNVVGLRQAAK